MTVQTISEVKTEIIAKYPQLELSEAGHFFVPVSQLADIMLDLKESFGFDFLTNLTAVDYLEHFNVVYNISRTTGPEMIHIITKIDRKEPQVPSMVSIWGGAIWQEREAYDLLGIIFTGHPNLKRILLDDNWEDHPLRRDFQWEGGRD